MSAAIRAGNSSGPIRALVARGSRRRRCCRSRATSVSTALRTAQSNRRRRRQKRISVLAFYSFGSDQFAGKSDVSGACAYRACGFDGISRFYSTTRRSNFCCCCCCYWRADESPERPNGKLPTAEAVGVVVSIGKSRSGVMAACLATGTTTTTTKWNWMKNKKVILLIFRNDCGRS